jgi:hypothetical protein
VATHLDCRRVGSAIVPIGEKKNNMFVVLHCNGGTKDVFRVKRYKAENPVVEPSADACIYSV